MPDGRFPCRREGTPRVRLADDLAPLRAAVLVPVLFRLQRQLPQERARLSDPVQGRGLERRGAGDARRRGVHRPYLGPVTGVYSDWTPLEGRPGFFVEDIDTSDPWQFRNVLVR